LWVSAINRAFVRHFEPFCEPNLFLAHIAENAAAWGRLKALMPILALLVNVPKRLVVGSFSCKVMDQTPALTFEEWIGKTHAVPC
jgi:hypothetical protein